MIGCLLHEMPNAPAAASPAVTGVYRIGIVTEPWQRRAYFALRRRVFVDEQQLFLGTDCDGDDHAAIPIVAVSSATVADDDVVGTVRIHETSPGVWFGSRLAVDSGWRGISALASGLVRCAVTTAHARGCRTFLATVQNANVLLFRRMHWHALGDVVVCGRPHQLMRADLSFYPPTVGAAS